VAQSLQLLAVFWVGVMSAHAQETGPVEVVPVDIIISFSFTLDLIDGQRVVVTVNDEDDLAYVVAVSPIIGVRVTQLGVEGNSGFVVPTELLEQVGPLSESQLAHISAGIRAFSAEAGAGMQATIAPMITLQPVVQTVRPGQRAAMMAVVRGKGTMGYEWQRDGVTLEDLNSKILRLNSVSAADAGDYIANVTNGLGTVTRAPVRLTIEDTAAGRLLNLSSQADVGGDEEQLIPSFVAQRAVRLLVRAVGPALDDFGVTDTLADPEFDIWDAGEMFGTNKNWGDGGTGSAISNTAAVVVGFPLRSGSGDTALIYDYDGGPRSVPVRSADGGTGTALVEVYEVPTAGRDGRLVNLATRGVVQSGKTLMAGFVIGGTGARTVLIRGIGPALRAFGVAGVLTDPKMSLASGGIVLTSNDNWAADPFGQRLVSAMGTTAGAFALSADGADAALVITLPPGPYTVEITGKGDAAGGGFGGNL